MTLRPWHLALIGGALALTAAGSCARFLDYGPTPKGTAYANGFLVSAVLAGGPLVLLAFRLPRRSRERRPSLRQAAVIGAAAAAVTLGSYTAFMALMELSAARRYSLRGLMVGLIVVCATAFVVTLGAGELFGVGVLRRLLKREGAR